MPTFTIEVNGEQILITDSMREHTRTVMAIINAFDAGKVKFRRMTAIVYDDHGEIESYNYAFDTHA